MPSLSVAKAANAAFTPSYVPIMVITGATSGIGQAIAQLFANNQHGRARLVLVGRNRAAAESIIASLPKPPSPAAQDAPEQDQQPSTETTKPQPSYEFISCDMSLMKNVHDLARDLSTRLPHINFLVHSAGVFGFGGRQETAEGIDYKLASRYYARWALTNDLLPLLRKAKDLGQPASVLSILGAGEGPEKVDLEDLGLKKNYSGAKAMMQSVSYNDLMVAVSDGQSDFFLSSSLPGARNSPNASPPLRLHTMYPGFVDTGMFSSSNPILKFIKFLFRPILRLILTTPQDCAEYVLHALLDADKGMYRRNSPGDDVGMTKFPQADGVEKEEAQRRLWEHSLEVTTVP
ncbi:hypothetical protein NLJ89_g7828 [Agrocybe chaxingu]|uniref:Ketoreductase (KR) domain-containing protein n=1 Tax=Agrocybe chaxingu TaxID=84603 RepID=A0A9W8JYH3_9AGAR|nr:hypothetical protein NLJ89_g7828 [Agrocybe chaxingu]